MPLPLPQPRAMFVAAFALAAAHTAPKPQLSTRKLAPSTIARRDPALRRLLTSLGSGFVAAGRAHKLFRERGAMWAHPLNPLRLDARVRAILASPDIAAFIGELAPFEDCERAWVEPGDNHVTLMWRGGLVYGEPDRNGVREVAREIDEGRFRLATAAAAAALDAAGFETSGLVEVRWLQIGPRLVPGAWRKFTGYVATIHLKRRRPVWVLGPSKGAAR